MIEELPRRKPLRLTGYDYSQAGVYFVTICTRGRVCCLSQIVPPACVGALHEAPAVILTDMGQIVETMIQSLPRRYPGVTVIKYVIMPNHVHLLLKLPPLDPCERAHHDAPLRPGRTKNGGSRSLLAKMIGYLKMNVTKEVHNRYPDFQLWQTRYHDHVVRNDADYLRIWNYIDTNPAQWAEDQYYIP